MFRLLCIISASFHQIIVDGGNSYRGKRSNYPSSPRQRAFPRHSGKIGVITVLELGFLKTFFRAVRMQSEMCWLETSALEVNSRVVINKVKVFIKDLHLVAFRVVEEVVETLKEGLKAVVATIMGDLDPITLVKCKEAAGMNNRRRLTRKRKAKKM